MLRSCLILAFASLVLPLAPCQSETNRPAQVRVQRDVVYAPSGPAESICDVYSPVELDSSQRVPAVLLIHGGAWSSGSKTMMTTYGIQIAQAGAVAVAINYRHAPKHKFPAQVDDVRDALVWIHDHATDLSIDSNRIGIYGYSAGGHLACLMATMVDEPIEKLLTTSAWSRDDARWSRLPKIAAVVAGGPPCDFRALPVDNTGMGFFLHGSRAEYPEIYAAASPTSFASKGDCPICFIHGERDILVPIQTSRTLYDKQLALGVKCEFVVVEKQGHIVTFLHPTTRDTVSRYLQQQLGFGK